jgi:hypothetical protein
MGRSTKAMLSCLPLAALFAFLFHGAATGLNLLLFELAAAVAWVGLHRRPIPPLARLALFGTLLTALMVVAHASTMAVTMNLVSAALFAGVMLAPAVNALHRVAVLAMAHVASIPLGILHALPFPHKRSSAPSITAGNLLSFALVPLVLLVFSAMYRSSNPHFDRFMASVVDWFGQLDLPLIGSFLVGLLISGFLLLPSRNAKLIGWAHQGDDRLLAGDQPLKKLQGERLTALLLLAGLNLLLVVANVLDIRHVWLGFEFNGQYLKQFVHEGTYMLLFSILLGAAIVLYCFRGGLNFMREAWPVKWLAYAWLGQNILLALSVGMRNYWYIHYYALAYKRIGVAFFLLALCIGLVLVVIKVRRGRSPHYLLRTNVLALYGVALVMSVFNWDGIMAGYNMAQQGKAFVHLDFLAGLSDKALPWSVKPQEDLEVIAAFNATLVGGAEHYSRDLYMEPEAYRHHIQQRVTTFLHQYPERSWKEWNWADARAYRMLSGASPQ